jgi:hypothetical protein
LANFAIGCGQSGQSADRAIAVFAQASQARRLVQRAPCW